MAKIGTVKVIGRAKKIFSIILCVIILVFTQSCSLFSKSDKHEHDFSGEWQINSAYHWKICSFDGCREIAEKSRHDYENGFCKECNHKEATINAKDS